MGNGLDGWGSITGTGKRFFSIPQHPDWLQGSPNLLSDGHHMLAVFPSVKQLGCEAGHSPPSSAEVKNSGDILPFTHTTSWHDAYSCTEKTLPFT
jgi:hypothetical protein